MRSLLSLALLVHCLFACVPAGAQGYFLKGIVSDSDNNFLDGAIIELRKVGDTLKYGGTAQVGGNFLIGSFVPAEYNMFISYTGYQPYEKMVRLISSTDIGTICLKHASNVLDEVKIVSKVIAMVQRDDTIEFNSNAYKVNPDADASDLIKKMPTISMNGKTITSQGENVVKILVDGKPFFGDDPYAAIKNLPADIIDKVQVYNEKSDQEQFTGFNENATSKAINIITKPARRRSIFGNVVAEEGADNSINNKYGTGILLSKFDNERRGTVTLQSNNINVQNSGDQSNVNANSGNMGVFTTHLAGIDYSDKYGKNTDFSSSYFLDVSRVLSERKMVKIYTQPSDSGQVYNENSLTENNNISQRLNLRLNQNINSRNSILLRSDFSTSSNNAKIHNDGFTAANSELVNRSVNDNSSVFSNFNFLGNLLYRHRFPKKGRTLSLNITANEIYNSGTNQNKAANRYYTGQSVNDSLDQSVRQQQSTPKYVGNITFTEPAGRKGLVKLEYTGAFTSAGLEKETSDFSQVTNSYALPDSFYSGSFTNNTWLHRSNISYQHSTEQCDFSVGVVYEQDMLENYQSRQSPVYDYFQRILPVSFIKYKLSKTKNIQCNYISSMQIPTAYQFQNMVNNKDPLHLYAGNPILDPSYIHNVTVKYSSLNVVNKNYFSASVSGSVIKNYISSNSVIALHDSMIYQHIILAKGSQLTTPANMNGYWAVYSRFSYGLPLDYFRCNLNVNINAGIAQIPSAINGLLNFQENKNGEAGATISSNISKNVDFILLSTVNLIASSNSINPQLNRLYLKKNTRSSINVILKNRIVINSAIEYQSNSGLSAGYNANYLVWNISIGKKIFKKSQGDIRLSVFDVFNQNSNIQYSTTDTYVQETHSNLLQRYFLCVFAYKINSSKGKE